MANNYCIQYCKPSNPCWCIQTTSSPSPSPTSCLDDTGECCLKVCNAILECTDSVGPCGAAGSFDLTTLNHITTGCTGTVQYALETEDGFFADVNITKAGVLTWVTGGPETVNKYGNICYRMTCQSDCDDCITLNSLGYIDIGVNDMCRNVVCDGGSEVCDSCTGDCIEQTTDISIESEE